MPTPKSCATWAPQVARQAARRCPSCATWPAISRTRRLQATLVIDRDTASRLGITASGHRRHALRRLRPAPGLDHVHPAQPVPRGPGGRPPEIPMLRHLRPPDAARRTRIYVALNDPRNRRQASRCRSAPSRISRRRPARWPSTTRDSFPAVTLSFNLAPGASLGDAVTGDSSRPSRRSACRPAFSQRSRARRGLPGFAGQRTAADPGGARHRLHRARRAVRELHPPASRFSPRCPRPASARFWRCCCSTWISASSR